MTSPCTWHIFK